MCTGTSGAICFTATTVPSAESTILSTLYPAWPSARRWTSTSRHTSLPGGPYSAPLSCTGGSLDPQRLTAETFMRTLVPKSLWSCLSQPIPGSTCAEHRAMFGLALEERVKHLEMTVHQAHDPLCSNPLPWDPILWAHPSDPLNPFSVSHGTFRTSVHMPSRTRPIYQHPPPLPKHAFKKPSKPASAKAQQATRRAPKNSKRPSSCASAPRPPAPRPFPALFSTHAHGHHKNPIDHHKPIRPQSFGRPPKRTKTALPLPPQRSKARYRQTRLPLPSRPTATRCPGPSAPAPPHSNASQDIRNFFRLSNDLLSPPLDPFSPLPLPEPPPSPTG